MGTPAVQEAAEPVRAVPVDKKYTWTAGQTKREQKPLQAFAPLYKSLRSYMTIVLLTAMKNRYQRELYQHLYRLQTQPFRSRKNRRQLQQA